MQHEIEPELSIENACLVSRCFLDVASFSGVSQQREEIINKWLKYQIAKRETPNVDSSTAPLEVKVTNGVLSISIGLRTLAATARIVVNTSEIFSINITDLNAFGQSMLRSLELESVDGSTAVKELLNTAVFNAWGDGAKWFDYGTYPTESDDLSSFDQEQIFY
jgi:hypothetical protein